MKWLAMIPSKPLRTILPFPESLRILLIKRSQSPTDNTKQPITDTTPTNVIVESYNKLGT